MFRSCIQVKLVSNVRFLKKNVMKYDTNILKGQVLGLHAKQKAKSTCHMINNYITISYISYMFLYLRLFTLNYWQI